MTRREWIGVLGALPAMAQFKPIKPTPPEAPEQEPTIKVEVELVNLFCSVRDKRGSYVASLSKDDFEVLEDGKPQTLKVFTRETDMPLTIGLLVDVSGSQEALIEPERAASIRFFQQVLRQKDEAFIISFGVDSELLQDYTNSLSLLRRALNSLRLNAGVAGPTPSTLPGSGRGTVLYEAVMLAADEKLKNEVGRKVMVVITDGDDVGSRVKKEQAVEAAQRADSIIYSVLYEDPRFHNPFYGGSGGNGAGVMQWMADQTGGHCFRVGRRDTLESIYDQIQQEMRSQYVLGYTPTNSARDGSYRKLDIRLRDKNLKAVARKGYFASKG